MCIHVQDGSEVKTALTISAAVIVYLVSTGFLSPWLSRLQRSIPWHRDHLNREMTIWAVLTEAQILFVGYFASLFPGWTIPEPQVGRNEETMINLNESLGLYVYTHTHTHIHIYIYFSCLSHILLLWFILHVLTTLKKMWHCVGSGRFRSRVRAY